MQWGEIFKPQIFSLGKGVQDPQWLRCSTWIARELQICQVFFLAWGGGEVFFFDEHFWVLLCADCCEHWLLIHDDDDDDDDGDGDGDGVLMYTRCIYIYVCMYEIYI